MMSMPSDFDNRSCPFSYFTILCGGREFHWVKNGDMYQIYCKIPLICHQWDLEAGNQMLKRPPNNIPLSLLIIWFWTCKIQDCHVVLCQISKIYGS